jgi:hypothetical protein
VTSPVTEVRSSGLDSLLSESDGFCCPGADPSFILSADEFSAKLFPTTAVFVSPASNPADTAHTAANMKKKTSNRGAKGFFILVLLVRIWFFEFIEYRIPDHE